VRLAITLLQLLAQGKEALPSKLMQRSKSGSIIDINLFSEGMFGHEQNTINQGQC
jgi:hypothetical protein